jgi:hypothetical protein
MRICTRQLFTQEPVGQGGHQSPVCKGRGVQIYSLPRQHQIGRISGVGYTPWAAISNSRLLAMDERGVTFCWKD